MPAATNVRSIRSRPIEISRIKRRAWRDSYNRWDDDRGMGPGGVAASAPIGGEEYARRNGFVCLPGTWFRGEDARMHICQ